MKMETTHYLPSEELKLSNYPEVREVEGHIELIMHYAMIVDKAMLDYNENVKNRIDLDQLELRSAVENCRTVCEKLGTAPNVCFDILLEIRSLQMNFQEIIFMKNRFGNEYVGIPSVAEDFDEEGGIR